jgi:membrane fusion protein (multidrug efflux system)
VRSTGPPLPKRSKGRFFVAVVFLAAISMPAYLLWTSYFLYQSYGVIQGRVINVSAPWDGVLLNWQVTEGEIVKQGQSLAEIANLEMRHSVEALLDDLKLTQAQLQAETARLKFEQHSREDTHKKAQAEYLQAFGELEAERALFEDLQKQLQRSERLVRSGNLSQQKYDRIYYQHVGQGRKIEKLQTAVQALKIRAELSVQREDQEHQQQIQPLLAKIETTQSEINRLREKIRQGRLIAPVSGRITRRLILTGESVQISEPIVEILEDNSTEAVLYVPQQHANRFKVGQLLAVELEPYEHHVRCEVIRLDQQLESPPTHIERYYRVNEVLLPVHLKPLPEYEQCMSFRVNGLIKLPIEWKQDLADLFDTASNQLRSLYSDVVSGYRERRFHKASNDGGIAITANLADNGIERPTCGIGIEHEE